MSKETDRAEQQVRSELEPFLEPLETRMRELGMAGVAVMQFEHPIEQVDEGLVQGVVSRALNMERVFNAIRGLQMGTLATPESAEELRALYEENAIPAPLLFAVLQMIQGEIDPKEAMNGSRSDEILRKLTQEMVQSEHGKKFVLELVRRKLEGTLGDSWEPIMSDEGNLLGFRNPKTGESDYFN